MTRQPAYRPLGLRAFGIAAAVITTAGLVAPAMPATAHSLPAHAVPVGHPRQAAPRGRVASPAVLASRASAVARARATGRQQVVAASTTPTSITVARPDGTFQMTTNVLPVRLRVHGRWRPVSTRLRREPGGTWSPVLVPSPVTLSGGGTGQLAVLHSGGRQLAVTWPRPLPAPAITGSTATYHVAAGLVLRVTVSSLGGISITASGRDPAALHSMRLRLAGSGLTVSTSRDGAITASPRRGGPVLFSGPAPAASPALTSVRPAKALAARPITARPATAMTVARTPGGGLTLTAGKAASPAGPVADVVSLTPDTASLGCSNSSGVWCTLRNAYDGLSQNCGSHYDTEWVGPDDGQFNEGALVGQDFWGGCGTNRAYYVMDTSSLTSDMRIQNATLHTWLSSSSDGGCSGTKHQWPLYLYDLGRGAQISSATTWTTGQPTLPSSPYKTDSVAPGPPSCTNNRDITFTVWDPIVNAKSNNYEYWTFALTGEEGGSYGGTCDATAANNSDNCGLMRIGDENGDGSGSTQFPYVVTTFDLAPPQPEIDTSGDTSPIAYLGPNDVAGLNPPPADGCQDLVTEPVGWIDSASSVSLRADLQALDSRVGTEPEWAKYELSDDTEGTTFSDFYSANGYPNSNLPSLTNTVIPNNLWNGHMYTWETWSWVNGTGGNPNTKPVSGSDPDGPYTSATDAGLCSFGIDTSSPTGLTVTSTDFPAPGSGPASKYAGQPGNFSFSAIDNPPTNCTPDPCTISSGVWGYAYSLNQSVFTPTYGTNGNTVLAGSNGGATVTITPGNWGINNLYVEAIDAAGNFSQEKNYTFYAPFNPASYPTPGDVTGADHIPDLLATTGTSTGGLNLYNDPGTTATAWPTAVNASANDASPDGANDWNSFDLSHRGMEQQEASGLDDLWAIKPSTGGQPGGDDLYLYQNNPANPGTDPYGSGAVSGSTTRPACSATSENGSNCLNYPADWTSVTGIAAVGDAWAGDPANGTSGCLTSNINCDYQNQASLITADSNGTLWLYQDKGGSSLINPVQLGSGGWNNMTLLAPGQLGNGQLTLWARDNNTGDTQNYGKIFAYAITLVGGIPTLNPAKPASPVSATSGTVLPVTAPASTYPYIATPGDAGIDGGPNLYAIDTSGNIWVWPYTANGTLSTSSVKLATITPGTITGLY